MITTRKMLDFSLLGRGGIANCWNETRRIKKKKKWELNATRASIADLY